MTTDAEIGSHLDLSTRWVRELRAKQVLPAAGGDLDANRRAYLRHLRSAAGKKVKHPDNVALDAQRARLASEQADQIALRNAALRAEFVPLAEITAALIGMIEVVKAKLRRVPARVAGSDAALKARIAAAVDDALVDLAANRAVPPAPPAG